MSSIFFKINQHIELNSYKMILEMYGEDYPVNLPKVE